MASRRNIHLGIWGDSSRRHASLKTDGDTVMKISHDFQPSSAISRIAGFHTFHAEVLVQKAMRGTAIGVALASIELDQPWCVPGILKKWEMTKQKELNEAKIAQEKHRKESTKQIAMTGILGMTKEKRAATEFERKQAQLHADNVVLQAGQELREAQQAVLAIEAKLHDSFGPRVWFFTCEGLLYAGEKLLASTGVTYGDGDRVKIDLRAHELTIWVNDVKVPAPTAVVATRVFFAVCLQNKGAIVTVIDSSHAELEELRSAKGIEDAEDDANVEPDGSPIGTRPATHASERDKPIPGDVLASVAVLAEVLMDRWSIVDQAFRALDANGDGMISHFEFKSVISQFGITEEELKRPIDDVWNYLDSDGSGSYVFLATFLTRLSPIWALI